MLAHMLPKNETQLASNLASSHDIMAKAAGSDYSRHHGANTHHQPMQETPCRPDQEAPQPPPSTGRGVGSGTGVDAQNFLLEYDTLAVIGSGSFGRIVKVRRKLDGQVMARKEVDYRRMREKERRQLVAEVNILRELNHPNIVRYQSRFVDRENYIMYIMMEFCEGGDLATVIRRHRQAGKLVPEETIWSYFAQLVDALYECHFLYPQRHEGAGPVLHRDIKPENVFLDVSKNVKLGDFGLSTKDTRKDDNWAARTFVGTPFYMSPELVNETSYNEKSDIWALGCLIYELCALEPPFRGNSHRQLHENIRSGQYDQLPSRYSRTLRMVVGNMLQVLPSRRPTAAELRNHPAIRKASDEKSKQDAHTALMRDVERREEEVRQRDQQLVRRQETLDAYERSLMERERALNQREEELLRRETAVCTREAALLEREADVSAKMEECQSRMNTPARDMLNQQASRLDISSGRLSQVQRSMSATPLTNGGTHDCGTRNSNMCDFVFKEPRLPASRHASIDRNDRRHDIRSRHSFAVGQDRLFSFSGTKPSSAASTSSGLTSASLNGAGFSMDAVASAVSAMDLSPAGALRGNTPRLSNQLDGLNLSDEPETPVPPARRRPLRRAGPRNATALALRRNPATPISAGNQFDIVSPLANRSPMDCTMAEVTMHEDAMQDTPPKLEAPPIIRFHHPKLGIESNDTPSRASDLGSNGAGGAMLPPRQMNRGVRHSQAGFLSLRS